MRASEEQWRDRVRRWRESGLSARQFAEEIGVSPSTLTYWGWRFRRMAPRAQRKRSAVDNPRFVELPARVVEEPRFELELADGRRLRIPSEFDAAALRRLLSVLSGDGDASR
jgi:hypothetical protein